MKIYTAENKIYFVREN